MRKLKLFITTFALLGGVISGNAQGWTASEVGAGEYYLYNVGAQGYLTNGARWGSHAAISNEGFLTTLSKVSDGVYTIATPIYHGDTHWFSDNGYVDSNETNWTFEPVSGQLNTYKLKTPGGKYAYAESGLYNVMVGDDNGDSRSYWKLVTAANRTDNNVASTSNPVDRSFLITNSRFDKNTDGWTGALANNAYGGNVCTRASNDCTESDWNTHNPLVERWHATTNFYQELSSLPNGKYIVKCQGFYKADAGSTHESFLYANDKSAALNLKTGDGFPNDKAASSTSFSNGNYWNSVTVNVIDGTLKIGIKTEDTNNWTIWDNFQLFYCGNDCSSSIVNAGFDATTGGWTGIGAVSNSETEFYNTTGGFDMYQDISGLGAGIYAVEAQGFYRNGSGIDVKRAKANESLIALLYAKGEDNVERNTTLLSMYEEAGKVTAYSSLFGDVPNWMNQAQDFISAGYYSDNKVIVEVGEGGTLRIGAKKSGGVSEDWTILDNFTLTKLNYSTLSDAYAAEWVSRKAEATALLSDATVDAGSTQRTAVTSAIALTPSDMEGYTNALTTLREAVNNFKAAKYAYALYSTNATAATEAYNAETTTYVNVTGIEKTTFNTAYSTNVSSFSPATNNAENYYNAAIAIASATEAFTEESIKNNYNEYAAEVATAGLLGVDITSVSVPTTSAEALTAAHTINVLNYAKVVAEEYEDVSATTLGAWTDNNVSSRSGQHWNGTNDTYFEMNSGWGSTSWTMSRTQDVSLAAGKYILKVAARVSPYANATLSVTVGGSTISTISGHQGDNGMGITLTGEASYDNSKSYRDVEEGDNKGRGFEWKYIPFELAETGTATLSFTAEGHAQYQFVSFTSLALLTDPKVAARTALLNKINEANTAYNGGTNVGTGVFQIPTEAGTTFSGAIATARGVYDNSSAELSDITGATTTLDGALTTYQGTTLNAPDPSKHYNIIVATTGHEKNGNAIVLDRVAVYPVTSNNYVTNNTGFTLAASAAPNANLAQACVFTPVEGKANTYNISMEREEGTVYLTYGSLNDSKVNWKAYQIQATTDASKKGEFKIAATTTANVFNIINTETNSTIACQSGGNIYTEDGNADFTLAEATQVTVDVEIDGDVKYATRIFPFTPTLPEDVTAYTCSSSNGATLTLAEVSTLAANTPYILYKEDGLTSTDLTGWGVLASLDATTTGWLTGVYADTDAPVGSYVLQYNNDKAGFYQVATGKQPTVGANRCYLSEPAGLRAFFFPNDSGTSGIDAIEALVSGEATIYNAAGAQVPALQKGVNIIKTKSGVTRKVMVK